MKNWIYSVSHIVLGALRSVLFTLGVWDCMYSISYAFVHVFSLPCHTTCPKLSFAPSCTLILDLFRLPYHSRCPKRSLVCICSVILNEFCLLCCSRCLHFSFVYSCLLRLDVFHLSCHSMCIKLNFTHTFSHAILLVLISISPTPAV